MHSGYSMAYFVSDNDAFYTEVSKCTNSWSKMKKTSGCILGLLFKEMDCTLHRYNLHESVIGGRVVTSENLPKIVGAKAYNSGACTPASGGHQLPGATWCSPYSRWTTSTRPGVHEASGDVNHTARGEKEGSVDKFMPGAIKYPFPI